MKKNSTSLRFSLDFVGVGFPRCGTTWVARCLQQHPQVDFSRVKETNYFCSTGDHTLALGGNPFKTKSFTEYKLLFKNNGNLTGEFSTNYINDPKSIKLINKKFSNIKIIVCLRDPVDALYSTFWYLKNSHRSSELPNTIKGCINNQTPLFKKMVDTFDYNKHLIKVFKYFSTSQVHIIYYSDIVNDKQKVIKDLYLFLGINTSFVPSDYNKRVNSLNKSRFLFVNILVSYFIKVLRFFKLEKIYYKVIVKFPVITKLYNKLFRTSGKKEPLSNNTKKELYKLFSDSVNNLENTLGKDLSSWKSF